jgi:hypothetical protein
MLMILAGRLKYDLDRAWAPERRRTATRGCEYSRAINGMIDRTMTRLDAVRGDVTEVEPESSQRCARGSEFLLKMDTGSACSEH